MLTTPNMQSSGNDNDSSDDYSIINTPSPQPDNLSTDNNNKLTSSISQLKESEEIDDFEHLDLSLMNVPKTTANENDSISTSAEQSDFDLIDIALKESQSDHDAMTVTTVDSISNLSKPSKSELPRAGAGAASNEQTPEPEDYIIAETVKSTVNLTDIEAAEYGEQKIETLPVPISPSMSPKSESSSPKATMDEIVALTEPFNSSSSSVHEVASDGPVYLDQENQPLIEPVLRTQEMNEKKRKNSYLKKEYERYVLDQRSDERAGLNGYLCCRYNNNHSNEQQVNETRNFFDSLGCFVDFVAGYMDKCFGADQFNDDFVPRKPIKPYKQI